MKENLCMQIYKATVYRKLVVWKDLNIQLEEYQSYTVVEKVKQMNKFIETEGYIPIQLPFEEINLDTPGFFSFSEQSGNNADSTEYLDQTIGSLIEMENLIKKNFMMQPEKLKEFANNNPTQISLRDECQRLNLELLKVREENKKLIESKINNKENDSKN